MEKIETWILNILYRRYSTRFNKTNIEKNERLIFIGILKTSNNELKKIFLWNFVDVGLAYEIKTKNKLAINGYVQSSWGKNSEVLFDAYETNSQLNGQNRIYIVLGQV